MQRGSRKIRAELREAIGWRLRTARRARGIRAKDLAARLEIHANALSQMELGRQGIPAELLIDWCSEVQISLQFAATGIENAEILEVLPPRHARLLTELDPHHRQLILEHMELVARWARKELHALPEE